MKKIIITLNIAFTLACVIGIIVVAIQLNRVSRALDNTIRFIANSPLNAPHPVNLNVPEIVPHPAIVVPRIN